MFVSILLCVDFSSSIEVDVCVHCVLYRDTSTANEKRASDCEAA